MVKPADRDHERMSSRCEYAKRKKKSFAHAPGSAGRDPHRGLVLDLPATRDAHPLAGTV